MEIETPHAGCQPAPRPRLRHTPASGDVTVTNSSEVQIYDTREGSSSRHESINVLRDKKKIIITVFTFKIRVLINVLWMHYVSDCFPILPQGGALEQGISTQVTQSEDAMEANIHKYI